TSHLGDQPGVRATDVAEERLRHKGSSTVRDQMIDFWLGISSALDALRCQVLPGSHRTCLPVKVTTWLPTVSPRSRCTTIMPDARRRARTAPPIARSDRLTAIPRLSSLSVIAREQRSPSKPFTPHLRLHRVKAFAGCLLTPRHAVGRGTLTSAGDAAEADTADMCTKSDS